MTKARHVMITCYDAMFAQILTDSESVDSLLVGDSLGMVIQGASSTHEVTLEQMAYHVRAVKKGVQNSKSTQKPLVIGDLPIHSYDDATQALKSAQFLVEAGADIVKLEGPVYEQIQALRKNGIRVCAHIGLTPQSTTQYRLQGKNEEESKRLITEAMELDRLGVEWIVLEMIPSVLAEKISQSVKACTIGIGAGPQCGGQVLVLYDMLGFNRDFSPKFLKRFSDGYGWVSGAIKNFSSEVRSGDYPGKEHSF